MTASSAPAARDVPDLLRRVAAMLDRGRPAAARALLNGAMAGTAPTAGSIELQARLLVAEQRPEAARALLDEAVAQHPRSARLWLARCGVRLKAGDARGAAADAAEAVVLDPGMVRAKGLLGVALLDLGTPSDARACLAEVLAAEPADPTWRKAMARACEACGDLAQAARCLEDGVALRPEDYGLRAEAMLLHMRAGNPQRAEMLAEAARSRGFADACVLGLLGHARSTMGRHEDAVEAYEAARKLAPEDPYVRHLVAAAGLLPNARRAAAEYVTSVFDKYAPRFDQHLEGLGYRIPGVIADELAARRRAGVPVAPVLDLGCGTGLLAAAAAPLGLAPWIGVDLSPGMLAQAARRQLYAALHEQDIEEFLARDQRRFATLLAADVLIYFGDLVPVLSAAAPRIAPGGCFMFSVESLSGRAELPHGWGLGRLGRYAHSAAHVTQAVHAAGLRIAVMRPEAIRTEAGAPVAGLFVVLERSEA